jgi:hypothetical protein
MKDFQTELLYTLFDADDIGEVTKRTLEATNSQHQNPLNRVATAI